MNTFRFSKLLVPSQPRSESLRNSGYVGGGIVAVSGQSIGTSDLLPSQIVNNYITNNYNTTIDGGGKGYYRGRISIANLLALEESEIGTDDMYLVYASGDEENGWSTDSTFTLNDETYNDGTFVQRINGEWNAVDSDLVDLSNVAKFDEMPQTIQLLTSTTNSASYYNLPYSYRAGIEIGKVSVYKWNADTQRYEADEVVGSLKSTNTKTIVIPYAKTYFSGGEMHYKGGVLNDGDYEKLCKMESGGSVTITDTLADGELIAKINDTPIKIPSYAIQDYAVTASDSYLTYSPSVGYYYNSVDRLYAYYFNKAKLPYFYSDHTSSTVPSAQSNKAGMCVGTDGVWWYNGSKWSNIVPTHYGICIAWYVSGDTNYFSGSEKSNVTLENYETSGGYAFTLSIDGITDRELLKRFLREHIVNVTMTGDNGGIYQQINLNALSTFTLVEYASKQCIKIQLPNRLYYLPTDDDDTYFSISFASVIE